MSYPTPQHNSDHRHYYDDREKVQAYIDKDKNYHVLRSKVLDDFLIDLPAKGHVLDVGCGYGYDVNQLRNKGYDAYGFDQSDAMVKTATELYGPYFKPLSLFDLGKITNEYDIVMSRNVLVHVDDNALNLALEMMYKVIKPGGYGIVSSKHGTGISITHTTGTKRETRVHEMNKVGDVVSHMGAKHLESPHLLDLPSTNKDPLFVVRFQKPHS